MATKSRVFVPHPVVVQGGKHWKFDTAPIIKQYGEIVCVLPSSAIMATKQLRVAMDAISEALIREEFDPYVDYFLGAGDMMAYAGMMVIAAKDFGATPKQLRHLHPSHRHHHNELYEILPIIEYHTKEETV
jgi:hypothetical protein